MRTVASAVPVAWCICQTVVYCALKKTAKRIEVLFGLKTRGGPRNIVLDGVPVSVWRGSGGFLAIVL